MQLNNIQISRGIAALIVLLAHANLLADASLFNGAFIIGSCGVDFFFVLSGFIIYWTNNQNFGDPKATINYLLKRFRRVYPVYWLYTLLVLFTSLIVLNLTGKHMTQWVDMSGLGFIRTFLLLPTDKSDNIMPVLPVAWTLSYEIMFYVLFSVVFLIKPITSLIFSLIWVAAISARSLELFTPPSETSLLFIFTESRNLEFLMGCAAAYIVKSEFFEIKIGAQLLMLGISLLMASWVNMHLGCRWIALPDFLQFGVPFLLIVTGAAILDLHSKNFSGPLSRLALFIGDASYSIYLVHFSAIMIVVFITKQLSLPSIASFLSATIIALFAGCIAYITIERPIMRKLNSRMKFTSL